VAQAGPSAALAFLAISPLIAGEDAAAYDDLSARMSRMLTPSDILEQIWVRDVVDLTWETLRLRRLKAQFLTATAHEGLAMVLGPLLGAKTSDQVAPRWAARDAQALVQVDAVLAAADWRWTRRWRARSRSRSTPSSASSAWPPGRTTAAATCCARSSVIARALRPGCGARWRRSRMPP